MVSRVGDKNAITDRVPEDVAGVIIAYLVAIGRVQFDVGANARKNDATENRPFKCGTILCECEQFVDRPLQQADTIGGEKVRDGWDDIGIAVPQAILGDGIEVGWAIADNIVIFVPYVIEITLQD